MCDLLAETANYSTYLIPDSRGHYGQEDTGAIEGQGGSKTAYCAAVALVHGFALPIEIARRILKKHFDPRCVPPWSDSELDHKLKDAAEKKHEKPKGWLIGNVKTQDNPDGALGTRDPDSSRWVLSPRRTLPTARAYIEEFHAHSACPTIVYFGGDFREWTHNRYEVIEEGAIRCRLQSWLHGALRVHVLPNGAENLVPFDSNTSTIAGAIDAVANLRHLSALTPIPSWLTDDGLRLPPAEILSLRSGNLHLPTRELIAPTPALFTTSSLDIDFDPEAKSPVHWLAFLNQLWPNDAQSIEMLQEWFGLCLTSDTSHHKALSIVGPPRSGKGTIARVQTKLVGASNVSGPTVSGLASQFGLQSLIGKPLAIVSDARFTGDGVPVVIERVLCITGEDMITIDRKHKPSVDMKLPTRFMFLTNELPRLNDSSTAIANRFLILKLNESFLGREDHELTERLYGELPGILLWAIDGWDRLRKRGRFVQPESSADDLAQLVDLASPVKAFVTECCDVLPGFRTYVEPLHVAWTRWCKNDGRVHVTSKSTFGKDLVAACPKVKWRRDGQQTPFYDGISLSRPPSWLS